MAVLQITKGMTPGQQFLLGGDRAVMGRHPDCDIVLEAAAVSRQHAQILLEADEYYVEDLHSRNGTFVNGQPVHGRRRLDDGDRLKICDLAFVFHRTQPTDELITPAAIDPEATSHLAMMIDDDRPLSNSTILSKLQVTSGRSGVRLLVNSEVKLRAMIEISQNLGKAVEVEDVLPKLLDSLFKIFVQADRGFIALRSGPEAPLELKAVKYRREEWEEKIRISRTIINQVLESREAVLSADAASDVRFQSSQSIADLRIRSVMCAPLVDSDGMPMGVIQLDSLDGRQRFQQEDLDVLASIASQAAIAVDNAQLHEQAMKQQSVQRDLALAHKVQRGLLPAAPPVVTGYHFFDFYESANQVGGDYYDYVELSGARIAIILADVSGKGVSAALVMAKLSGEVRYCLASEPTPAAAVNRINESFCRSGWDDRFVTFVLAVLDPARHELVLVNAGHMPPLLRHRDGQVESVGAPEAGIPLGVDADFEYLQTARNLEPGDLVALWTDGISEAMNAAGELYGLERLRAQVAAPAANVSKLGRHILDDVKRFVGNQPQSDDMCLACLGRVE